MTAAQLIAELRKYPQHLPVCVFDGYGDTVEISNNGVRVHFGWYQSDNQNHRAGVEADHIVFIS